MTLRELLAALTEYGDDLLDTEVKIEDEYGVLSPIQGVAEANGMFIHPTRNFEEDWHMNANEIRVALDAADRKRREQAGADGLLNTLRVSPHEITKKPGFLARLRPRFLGDPPVDRWEPLTPGELDALYRALQIVRDEARTEAERIEKSVES